MRLTARNEVLRQTSRDSSRLAIAKARGVEEKELRRMLDPRHASKLPRVARVLKSLGKELRLSVMDRPAPPGNHGAAEAPARYRVRPSKRKRSRPRR